MAEDESAEPVNHNPDSSIHNIKNKTGLWAKALKQQLEGMTDHAPQEIPGATQETQEIPPYLQELLEEIVRENKRLEDEKQREHEEKAVIKAKLKDICSLLGPGFSSADEALTYLRDSKAAPVPDLEIKLRENITQASFLLIDTASKSADIRNAYSALARVVKSLPKLMPYSFLGFDEQLVTGSSESGPISYVVLNREDKKDMLKVVEREDISTLTGADIAQKLKELQKKHIEKMPVSELIKYANSSSKAIEMLLVQNAQLMSEQKIGEALEKGKSIDEVEVLAKAVKVAYCQLKGLNADDPKLPSLPEMAKEITPESVREAVKGEFDTKIEVMKRLYDTMQVGLKDRSAKINEVLRDLFFGKYELHKTLDSPFEHYRSEVLLEIALNSLLSRLETLEAQEKRYQKSEESDKGELVRSLESAEAQAAKLEERAILLAEERRRLADGEIDLKSRNEELARLLSETEAELESVRREKKTLEMAINSSNVSYKGEINSFKDSERRSDITAIRMAEQLKAAFEDMDVLKWEDKFGEDYKKVYDSLQRILADENVRGMRRFLKIVAQYCKTVGLLETGSAYYLQMEYEFIANNMRYRPKENGGTSMLEAIIKGLKGHLAHRKGIHTKLKQLINYLPEELRKEADKIKGKVKAEEEKKPEPIHEIKKDAIEIELNAEAEKEKTGATEKKQKKKPEPDNEFLAIITKYFMSNKIEVIQPEVVRKTELDYTVRIPSVVGMLEYYCKAKKKKKCNEGDLSSAFVTGQAKKLPILFLATGDLTKRANEMLNKEFKNHLVFKKI